MSWIWQNETDLKRQLDVALRAILDLQNRVTKLEKKEQTNMSTVNDAIAKLQASDTAEGAVVDTLSTAVNQLTTAFTQAIADLQKAIGNNNATALNAVAADLDAHTSRLTALNNALQGLQQQATTADPGTGTASTASTPTTPVAPA